MNAAIETRGLTKHYGDVRALENLDLAEVAVEVVALGQRFGLDALGDQALQLDTVGLGHGFTPPDQETLGTGLLFLV